MNEKPNYHKNGKCTASCLDQQKACKGWEPPIAEKQVCLHRDYDCDRCYSVRMRDEEHK
jgi:hypothetical protein